MDYLELWIGLIFAFILFGLGLILILTGLGIIGVSIYFEFEENLLSVEDEGGYRFYEDGVLIECNEGDWECHEVEMEVIVTGVYYEGAIMYVDEYISYACDKEGECQEVEVDKGIYNLIYYGGDKIYYYNDEGICFECTLEGICHEINESDVVCGE